MLETLDPVNRVAPARDDRERRVAEVARGSRHAGDRADHEAVIADARACDGASALAEDDRAAARPWSSDWQQLGHELRTPLNAMLGNIELLLDGSAGPLAAPVRACVGDLQMASRQLLRQAAAGSAPASQWCAAQGQDALPRRAAPRLPEGRCLMMAGDPVWLGALAATLVDLHGASPQAAGPLSIDLTELGEAPGGEPGEQPVGTGGTVLRAFWPGLEPAAVSPLPLALIDAVLALHGGRIRSLDADGLRLDLPGASVVQCSTSARGHR